MQKVEVQQNQNLFDIAAQKTGINDNVHAIARANEISVTTVLQAGMIINIPDGLPKDEKVLKKLEESNSLIPATGSISEEDALEGIDYWEIENDFIVS